MLPHTTSAVSAFPEDDVGRPTQIASKTGVGTTGLFLCSNASITLLFFMPTARAAARKAVAMVIVEGYVYIYIGLTRYTHTHTHTHIYIYI